ncbi:hypothetical protein EVAR_27240_1 [Eumeta japonica]|uniref:Uncharacterized protein n=1 Tax=Eumeta variegata TaxID=151549 RepID=A0A4C1W2J6_EUMVA|nr:hypothetical protein EVAR_27240_1 [Eumeta japonica]
MDTKSVSFETSEVVDRLGCIKASKFHKVMVYEDRSSEHLQHHIAEDKKAESENSRQLAHKENYKSSILLTL